MTDTTTPDQRTPEEIERDIRAAQDEMSRTVEQIGGELNARNILNSLLDKAEDGGIDARWLLDGARRNPIALGMIAIGGLWLVSDADARPSALGIKRRDRQDTGGWHPDHRRYVDHMAGVQPQAGEDEGAFRRRRDLSRASYFMIEQGHDEDEGAFRRRLDEATQTARETWSDLGAKAGAMGSKAGRTASDLAQGTRERARDMGREMQDFYADNPLIAGMAAALVGAVAGAMIPATRTEERYVGGLGEQALGAAGAQVRKVGAAARRTKDEAVGQIDSAIGGAQAKGPQDAGVGQEA